jgi:hypothetical protein
LKKKVSLLSLSSPSLPSFAFLVFVETLLCRSLQAEATKKEEQEAKEAADPSQLTEEQLMASLGFKTNFNTTKNKKVDGNFQGFAKVKPKRQFKQVMNRKGPPSFSRHFLACSFFLPLLCLDHFLSFCSVCRLM